MKSVFILGAGFSTAAGLPLQQDLLGRSLTAKPVDLVDIAGFGISSATSARDDISRFIAHAFPAVATPRLEDLFTCLDLAIARRQYFRGYSWQELYAIRDSLTRLINSFLHLELRSLLESKGDFYEKVAVFLLEKRLRAGHAADTFSVIQLNWDNVLEEKIFLCVKELGWQGRVDVDYCCFSNPLGDSPHVPSLRQKSLNIFNIKVQKLHGSINWLLCPNCDRMFTGLGGTTKPGELYLTQHVCPNCSENKTSTPLLEQYLVTPTYTKVFDNTHIQMIWHNAYVDLAAAEEVFFVGYSLPESDYHLRSLLLRSIRSDAKIYVVLAPSDAPQAGGIVEIHKTSEIHYHDLFGATRVASDFSGAEQYFHDKFRVGALGRRKRRLQGLIDSAS